MTRTRFAPSPTGYLHIGGARTALYCWLFAKKTNGTFILRIEDTDLERSTPESIQAILESMDWLGLSYDEGPFYQTKRFDRYHAAAEQLLRFDKAYRCYCTKERLDTLREEQALNKEKPRYDGMCRSLLPDEKRDEPFVIRFKNPEEGFVEFNDLIRGTIRFANSELDDLIIVRSDGSPTYNFTVVVDDWDMKITTVIRGDDHVNNTPRQINLLRSLGAVPPDYAHVPMILGSDGKRLSKRHGAVSVLQYRDIGILPHALLNYLVRLGWSHGDQEIFSMDELVQFFELDHIQHSPAAFNMEKLLWLNQHYLKEAPIKQLSRLLEEHALSHYLVLPDQLNFSELVSVLRERHPTIHEMVEKNPYFFVENMECSLDVNTLDDTQKKALWALYERFQSLTDWNKTSIHDVLAQTGEAHQLKMGKLAPPLRLMLTNTMSSPSIDVTAYLLGRDQVLKRMHKVLNKIEKKP